MNWENEVTNALHINYGIVQAPMLGVTTPEMVAEISNAGGLGSLPVGGLSPQKTIALIHATKALTMRPFAVNFFAHHIPVPDAVQVKEMKAFLLELCIRYQLPFKKEDFEPFRFYTYKEQIDIIIQEQIPVASFTFGIPDEESIREMKNKGIVLIGTATCVKEAILLDQKGVDIIAAQGIEAGGHRGSFLDEGAIPEVALMPLLNGIIEKTQKPVLAAGAICDGRTIKAAYTLGAKGVQIGTAFIAGNESAAIPSYKGALQQSTDTDSVLTRAFSGRWARGLRNEFMNEIEQSGLVIPDYPVQNSLTARIRSLAQQLDRKALTNLWAGQSAAQAEAKPVAVIFKEMIRQAEES